MSVSSQSKQLSKEILSINASQNNWRIVYVDDVNLGILTQRAFKKGETVFAAKSIDSHSKRDMHSIQVAFDRHVMMDLPGRLINHSCNANCGIRDNDLGAFDFVALDDIPANAELTWDYSCAEFDPITSPFSCKCGASNCRGGVNGFAVDKDVVIEQYSEQFVAKYLQEWLKTQTNSNQEAIER